MKMRQITPRRLDVLLFFKHWEQAKRLFAPSIRDVATALNKSPATVMEQVNILYSHGFLCRLQQGQYPRNYVLTSKAKSILGMKQ